MQFAQWYSSLKVGSNSVNDGRDEAVEATVAMVGMLAGGPAEEGSRLTVIAAVSRTGDSTDPSLARALSLATGWPGIEIVFFILLGVKTLRMLHDIDTATSDDARKRMVDELEEIKRSTGRIPTVSHPAAMLLERTVAYFFHGSCTVILSRNAWLMIPCAFLHSVMSVQLLKAVRRQPYSSVRVPGVMCAFVAVVFAVAVVIDLPSGA